MTFDNEDSDYSVVFIACTVCGVTCLVFLFLGCMWCRDKWKRLTKRQYRLSDSTHEASLQPAHNGTEFTIFPPPSSSQLSFPSGFSTDEVVFEPLPEIRSRSLEAGSGNIRPARFIRTYGKISLQDWFDEHQINFPRDQLKYLQEVGGAWYGQAVEGEAYNILESEKKTKVVVKILRVDATATEHMQYLQETRPFRYLSHPNLIKLLGRCLEVHPFLLVMEHCQMDLKTYLVQQRKAPETLLKKGLMLRMACNVASAIQHMHEKGFVHTDIAAHSCLVTSDYIIKVGDYGTAVHQHKEDFYFLGDVAFPIRWCAPESLMCSETVVEAKEMTKEANIWSLGVLIWEILEFGKLPYMGLNDNDVIQNVLIQCCLKLEQPKTPCVHKDMIYKIMQLCWLPATLRATIYKISTLLSYLYDNQDVLSESSAFESRWHALQPAVREHNLQNTPQNISMRFESDFISSKKEQDSVRDCDSMMSSEFDPMQYGDKSPSSGSFSMNYDAELASDFSPSLLNLHGSAEDLNPEDGTASVEVNSICSTSEPQSLETLPAEAEQESNVIELSISEALKDLDTILAAEQTSSDTSKCNTPEKVPSTKSNNFIIINGNNLDSEEHIETKSENVVKKDLSVSRTFIDSD